MIACERKLCGVENPSSLKMKSNSLWNHEILFDLKSLFELINILPEWVNSWVNSWVNEWILQDVAQVIWSWWQLLMLQCQNCIQIWLVWKCFLIWEILHWWDWKSKEISWISLLELRKRVQHTVGFFQLSERNSCTFFVKC